jgi:hypothetical protein
MTSAAQIRQPRRAGRPGGRGGPPGRSDPVASGFHPRTRRAEHRRGCDLARSARPGSSARVQGDRVALARGNGDASSWRVGAVALDLARRAGLALAALASHFPGTRPPRGSSRSLRALCSASDGARGAPLAQIVRGSERSGWTPLRLRRSRGIGLDLTTESVITRSCRFSQRRGERRCCGHARACIASKKLPLVSSRRHDPWPCARPLGLGRAGPRVEPEQLCVRG